MFKRILIANRGEIACRIIKTARRKDIACVAVYSEADAQAMHVQLADEAYCIGSAPSADSYLQSQRIIDVAKQTNSEAIHPGYGFLSENTAFARLCEKNNIVFIGPPASAIEAMGSKSAAKQIMEQTNVPLVPGYHGNEQDAAVLLNAANDMGYPVLLKAAAGGGGKGMRIVTSETEFESSLTAAKRESLKSFGDDKMLVEKYLTKPRHVEIQVFLDSHGNGVFLFERDCSVQRRHQKVLEEAPAPGMDDSLRSKMGETALTAARAINYVGAGTVEFLLNEDNTFYFMEMNTRLQVEHPVTEMISGQDLVDWQLRVAYGEILPASQNELSINGHAFEVRIYAEDPENDFLPATGEITFLQTPEEDDCVRIDTGVRQGDEVSVYYDPMIAKLIVWGEDRDGALNRMARALSEYRLAGVKTNLNLLQNIVNSEPFRQAKLDTGFIEKYNTLLFTENDISTIPQVIAVAALYRLLVLKSDIRQRAEKSNDPYSPWHHTDAWQMIDKCMHYYNFDYHDQNYTACIEEDNDNFRLNVNEQSYTITARLNNNNLVLNVNQRGLDATVIEINEQYTVYMDGRVYNFSRILPDVGEAAEEEHGGYLVPMNGTIVSVLVKPGKKVKKGETLIIIEAMKLEISVVAHADAVVKEVFFQDGDMVSADDVFLTLEEPE